MRCLPLLLGAGLWFSLSADAAPPPQRFADTAVDQAFTDPERRAKLASTYPAIDALVQEIHRKQKLPGIAYGIVIDGELAHARGFGEVDLDKPGVPDADTVYRIGSLTKSFTGLVIVSLRDQGKLSLDDPLVKYLPEAAGLVYPTRDSPPITIRHLLHHTSGLPRVGPIDYTRPDRDLPEAEVLGKLDGLALESAPGTAMSYSNLGYGLLGIVAARAAGVPYRELVQERILTPLGMSATVWSESAVPPGKLAVAYVAGKAVPHWRLGAVESAGGLYSSVRDLARYVAFQLGAYPSRNSDEGPIRRSSVRETHLSGTLPSLGVTTAAVAPKIKARAGVYAFGWGTSQTCDVELALEHNGGTEAYRSHIAFYPDYGVGFVLMFNTPSGEDGPLFVQALALMRKSGGLQKRVGLTVAPKLRAATDKLLALYESFDESAYRATLNASRTDESMQAEKAELAGYRRLHGACGGAAPLAMRNAFSGRFVVPCERGRFELQVDIDGEGRVAGFQGFSSQVAPPPALQKRAAAFAATLRRERGACRVALDDISVDGASFKLDCDRGAPAQVRIDIDAKGAAQRARLVPVQTGPCRVD